MQRGVTHWDCQGMTHSGRAGINLDRFSNPFYEVSWRFWLELTKHVADGKADTNFTLAMVIFHQTQVPSIPCPCIWFRRLNSPFSCWWSAQRAWSSLDLWPRLVLLVNFSTGNSSTRWAWSHQKQHKHLNHHQNDANCQGDPLVGRFKHLRVDGGGGKWLEDGGREVQHHHLPYLRHQLDHDHQTYHQKIIWDLRLKVSGGEQLPTCRFPVTFITSYNSYWRLWKTENQTGTSGRAKRKRARPARVIRLTVSMQEISGLEIVKKMWGVQSKYEGFASRRWGRMDCEVAV